MTQKSRKRFKYFENEKSFQESFFIIFKWLPKLPQALESALKLTLSFKK